MLRQAWIIAKSDLKTEGRSGELLWIVLPYGALALFLIPVATALPRTTLSEIGLGMYWVVVLLFGMFVTLRHSARDQQRDLLRLTLSDPSALFLGRTASSTLLLLIFQLTMGPVTIALFGPELPDQWWLLVGVSVLLAAAMGGTGTIVSGLVSGTAAANALAPLLAAALAFPSLVGASISTVNLVEGRSILTPVGLLLLVVVLTAVVGLTSSALLEDG